MIGDVEQFDPMSLEAVLDAMLAIQACSLVPDITFASTSEQHSSLHGQEAISTPPLVHTLICLHKNLRGQAMFDKPEFDRLVKAIREGVVKQLAEIVTESLDKGDLKLYGIKVSSSSAVNFALVRRLNVLMYRLGHGYSPCSA